MNNFRYLVQPNVHPTSPSLISQNSIELAGACLFLLFGFVVIQNCLIRYTQQKEAQLEAQRQLLERIWRMNSNLEH